MRKAGWVLGILLLATCAVFGFLSIPDEFRGSHGALQRSVSIGVVFYSVLATAGAIGMARRLRWSPAVVAAWGGVTTYVATVASFAFHDPGFNEPGTTVGTFATFLCVSLIALFIWWAARDAVRRASLPRATQGDHIPSS